MSKLCKWEEVPYIVLVGVPDRQALNEVVKYLQDKDIQHEAFIDNDFEFEMGAVVTIPLDPDQRSLLKHYPLWKSIG